MIEHVEVSGDVAVEIHRHEAGELQKARINLPAEAGIGEWHGVQAVAAEPFDPAFLGQLVDLGGAASGVDRATHQGHAGRGVGVAARLHQRGGGKQRHRRLTDADRVDARAEKSQHLAQIVDVVVEVEGAGRQRNHARVRPVGDVDIEIRQKRFDCASEQSRVVAGHRRDDQELRLTGSIREIGPDEAKQIAERLHPDDILEDRMDDSVDLDFAQSEGRLAVAAGHPLEQFGAGRDVLAERGAGERIPRIAKDEMGRVGHRARRRESGVGHLVELIGVAWRHADGPVTGRARANPLACHL